MMSLPVSVLQLLPNVLTGLCTIPVQISSISLIFSEHGCCVVTFWSSSWLDTVFHTVCSACWCVMRLFFSVFRCSSRNSLKWDNETPTWRHSPPLALGKNAKWTRQEQRRQALRYEPLHWTICTFHLAINSLLSSSLLSCDLWEVWFIWANQLKRSRFESFSMNNVETCSDKYFNSHINHPESTWLKLAWLTLQKWIRFNTVKVYLIWFVCSWWRKRLFNVE